MQHRGKKMQFNPIIDFVEWLTMFSVDAGVFGRFVSTFTNEYYKQFNNRQLVKCCNDINLLPKIDDPGDCPCTFDQQVHTGYYSTGPFEYQENQLKPFAECSIFPCNYRVCFRTREKSFSGSSYRSHCCYGITANEVPSLRDRAGWGRNRMLSYYLLWNLPLELSNFS